MRGKTIILAAAAVLLPALCRAARTQVVQYPSGSEKVSGYLAIPSIPGPHGALLVIHQWWGLDDWTRAKAERFADDGYVALAVDLYRGKTSNGDPEVAHELSRGLPEDRAIQDLKAAFDYLASRADVDPARIGVIGWCMGGGYSLAAAIAEPKLAACVVYYGRLVTDAAEIRSIRCPILGNFGALDRGISPDSVRAFEKSARAAGKTVDFKIYGDAGHAFASSSDPKVSRPADARDANARTDAFLAKYLGKG
jgi:carboxymethylenebutenolidase